MVTDPEFVEVPDHVRALVGMESEALGVFGAQVAAAVPDDELPLARTLIS